MQSGCILYNIEDIGGSNMVSLDLGRRKENIDN